ncbi:hypothetical protein ATANTOWER_013534 [Ataeniobius toweri]|uniref:Uncharacterized protein n=1 Tax=Ataeniobius toweri TaxID=208326 RepID=A0ABU7AQ47_9TELE|nr:hypothetical protein [Ataeniobius toweri]
MKPHKHVHRGIRSAQLSIERKARWQTLCSQGIWKHITLSECDKQMKCFVEVKCWYFPFFNEESLAMFRLHSAKCHAVFSPCHESTCHFSVSLLRNIQHP